jgi:hypothetical protein
MKSSTIMIAAAALAASGAAHTGGVAIPYGPHSYQGNQGPLSEQEAKHRADLRAKGRKGRRARQRAKGKL